MQPAEGARFRVRGSHRPERSLGEDTISKIAGVVLQSREATLLEVARELTVSRTTAIRWLALMESEELLSRVNLMSGKKGRPKIIYRPTSKLTKLVETRSLSSILILSFPTLKGACKYLDEDSCVFRAEVQPCAEALCPLLHS